MFYNEFVYQNNEDYFIIRINVYSRRKTSCRTKIEPAKDFCHLYISFSFLIILDFYYTGWPQSHAPMFTL